MSLLLYVGDGILTVVHFCSHGVVQNMVIHVIPSTRGEARSNKKVEIAERKIISKTQIMFSAQGLHCSSVDTVAAVTLVCQ